MLYLETPTMPKIPNPATLKGVIDDVRQVVRPFAKSDDEITTNLTPENIHTLEQEFFQLDPQQQMQHGDRLNMMIDFPEQFDPNVYQYNPIDAKRHVYGEKLGGARGVKQSPSTQHGATGSLHYTLKDESKPGGWADPSEKDYIEVLPFPGSEHQMPDGIKQNYIENQWIVSYSNDFDPTHEAFEAGRPVTIDVLEGEDQYIREVMEREGKPPVHYGRYAVVDDNKGNRYGFLMQAQGNHAKHQEITQESRKEMEDFFNMSMNNLRANVEDKMPGSEFIGMYLDPMQDAYKQFTKNPTQETLDGFVDAAYDARETLNGFAEPLGLPVAHRHALYRHIKKLEETMPDSLEQYESYKKVPKPDAGSEARNRRNVVRKAMIQATEQGLDKFHWPTEDAVRFHPLMNYPIAKAKELYDKRILGDVLDFLQDGGLIDKGERTRISQRLQKQREGIPSKPEVPKSIANQRGWTEFEDLRTNNPAFDEEYKDYERQKEFFTWNHKFDDSENPNENIVRLVHDPVSGDFHYEVNLQPVREKGHTQGLPKYAAAPAAGVAANEATQDPESRTPEQEALFRDAQAAVEDKAQNGKTKKEINDQTQKAKLAELAERIKRQRQQQMTHQQKREPTMSLEETFAGGMDQLKRGPRQVPGTYVDMVSYMNPVNWMNIPGLSDAKDPERKSFKEQVDEEMGVNQYPEPVTPFQKTMNFGSEVGTDIAGFGLLNKATQWGGRGIDALRSYLDDARDFNSKVLDNREVPENVPVLPERRDAAKQIGGGIAALSAPAAALKLLKTAENIAPAADEVASVVSAVPKVNTAAKAAGAGMKALVGLAEFRAAMKPKMIEHLRTKDSDTWGSLPDDELEKIAEDLTDRAHEHYLMQQESFVIDNLPNVKRNAFLDDLFDAEDFRREGSNKLTEREVLDKYLAKAKDEQEKLAYKSLFNGYQESTNPSILYTSPDDPWLYGFPNEMSDVAIEEFGMAADRIKNVQNAK